jgi:hypothetical protein
VTEKTKDFLAKACPSVPIAREMDEYETPLSKRKIPEVLGSKDVHDWKKSYIYEIGCNEKTISQSGILAPTITVTSIFLKAKGHN